MNYIENIDPEQYGLIFTRRENGELATNIPHLITVHSPTGWEVGYRGSGPADLALNICEYALRKFGWDGPTENDINDQPYFRLSWAMHQELKDFFIAHIPRQGGVFTWQYVFGWVITEMLGSALRESGDAEEWET